ncbi:hypothetical protein cypCar_00039514 [Cyprinus carpio]|nr:hypothetical protein cypCar_00039514 [Cyprinus carpio]
MIGKLKQNLLVACLVISSVTVFYLGRHAMECHHRIEERSPLLVSSLRTTLRTGQNLSTPFIYNKDMPLIFIGGVPRSGTTLMRAMLDAHPEVRCGEETRVIPRILAMKQMWSRSGREKMRLDEAGVTDEVLDSAMQAFLLEIIVKHGEPANYLCNKDPFALKSLTYLAKIFPHAKFILMIRDGRASVHSMISRKVTIAGFDLSSYRDCLTKWNRAIETMYTQCLEAADKCLPVHYEQLVLHPEKWMKTLLKFLNIPWNDAVLHHEELIGKAGGVSLSKVERSTDQVIKPVNVEALSKWVGKIPPDVLQDMPVIAPMLARLGYDPHANPPNYGRPDPLVLDNTRRFCPSEHQLFCGFFLARLRLSSEATAASEVPRKAKPKLEGEDQSFINRRLSRSRCHGTMMDLHHPRYAGTSMHGNTYTNTHTHTHRPLDPDHSLEDSFGL